MFFVIIFPTYSPLMTKQIVPCFSLFNLSCSLMPSCSYFLNTLISPRRLIFVILLAFFLAYLWSYDRFLLTLKHNGFSYLPWHKKHSHGDFFSFFILDILNLEWWIVMLLDPFPLIPMFHGSCISTWSIISDNIMCINHHSKNQ